MRHRRSLQLITAVGSMMAATVLLGGSVDPGRSVVSASPTSSSSAPAWVHGQATAAAMQQRQGSVTIAFGGDVHFEGALRDRVIADPGTLLQPVAPLLSSADLAIVNLETAVTDRGAAEPKEFTFRAPPEGLDALVAAGVDVVSLANNHGLDYGLDGLVDTLDAVDRSSLALVGGGRTEGDAYAPFRTRINGLEIAVIGATDVLDAFAMDRWAARGDQPGLASAKHPDRQRLVAAVARADVTNDVVVVMLHWGRERDTCPTAAQHELADVLVAAGADMVVGGHAHRVQGGGRKGEAIVHYGLGNFVFYVGGGPGAESGVFLVTAHGDGRPADYEWVPARLEGGVATPVEADDWAERRACTDLTS